MTGGSSSAGARLSLSLVGVRSCLLTGLVIGAAGGVAVFLTAIVVWQAVVPGVRDSVASAFAGSRSTLDALLGAGTGAAVAAVLAIAASGTVVVGSVVVPFLYDALARRTGGIGVVLADSR